MDKKVTNVNFFKSGARAGAAPEKPAAAGQPDRQSPAPPEKAERPPEPSAAPTEAVRVGPGRELTGALKELSGALKSMNQKQLAASLAGVLQDAQRDRFTVAVVGEFSRGKSTLINRLVGKDFLPVGNMPTTAVLTRIRHRKEEALVSFDKAGQRLKSLPLSRAAWDGLTAENFGGKEPEGTVLVGVNAPWLERNGIELMDTPGAGDLDNRRAQVIGEALLGADGAVITVSATSPLSLSEKLFIEQRLLSRKTPYLMLAVTKLDQVPQDQRAEVADYIVSRLKLWNMDIPVFLPYEVEMGTDRYQAVMGLERIRNQLAAWQRDPRRVQLTRRWIASRAASIADTAISSLQEQAVLLQAGEEKREELIRKKNQQLSKAAVAWEDLRLKLLERGRGCEELLQKKAQEHQDSITERLQYEAAHAGKPEKWWNEDYPYRLKVELANMSAGIENAATRRITEDANWFNAALEQQFKTHVLVEKVSIAGRDALENASVSAGPVFEDLEKKRTVARIGTTVLTIAGYALCTQIGALPLIATMGVGTGSALITERVFGEKLGRQQQEIKSAIRRNIPELIEAAMAESGKRLRAVYDDMLSAAVEKEKSWTQAQREAIAAAAQPENPEQAARVQEQIAALGALREKLLRI